MRALALAVAAMLCAGCGVVEYRPPSATILHLSPVSADGGTKGKTIDFGFKSLDWDTLASGYGAIGSSNHARDYEGYSYIGEDPEVMPRSEDRWILITPVREPGRACVYRLQLMVPQGLLENFREGSKRHEMLEGTITSPPRQVKDRLEFDLENIQVTAKPPGAGRYTLSGRVVATESSSSRTFMFEFMLHYFNKAVLQMEAQK